MMGERQIDQAALFYEFSLNKHVPADHMLRAVDRFVDLDGVRTHLATFYSSTGRPSIDPDWMMQPSVRQRPSRRSILHPSTPQRGGLQQTAAWPSSLT
jgi:hypothetical protein